MITQNQSHDVIIVGSGYGGMLPAYQLTQAGFKVLLIERGKAWQRNMFRHSWSTEYLGDLFDISLSTSMKDIYRGSKIFGGGSVMNDKIHHRTPSEAFDFIDPDIKKRAWPSDVNRKILNPFYTQLEELLSIHQIAWEDVSRIGGNFARMFNDAGLTCDRNNFNVGSGCVHCGFCEAGCQFPAGKLNLVSEVFHLALDTGNLEVVLETSVKSVAPLRGGGYQVNCIQSDKSFDTPATSTYFAPKVILAAGPIGTVPLLFRSKSKLPKLSPALGKWISNNGDMNFILKTPDSYPDHLGYRSATSTGVMTYAFWDEYRITMHPGMAPIPVFAGVDARREGKLSWGLEHKHFVKDNVINRLIPINAMGVVPAEITMEIDHRGYPKIHHPRTKALQAHAKTLHRLMKGVCQTVGGELLITGIHGELFDMGGNHIIGGARMSEQKSTGVVNPSGEVFDYPGLYVSDASAIPGSLGINPAHTIGANAMRIGHELVKNEGGHLNE
ncbi:MAG: GMC family oxidoreductase [Bdellovibrio sp.]|nr:GMC family oxidoreductase [Bdellovibrio sp.]